MNSTVMYNYTGCLLYGLKRRLERMPYLGRGWLLVDDVQLGWTSSIAERRTAMPSLLTAVNVEN
jgi:hypothetical protein